MASGAALSPDSDGRSAACVSEWPLSVQATRGRAGCRPVPMQPGDGNAPLGFILGAFVRQWLCLGGY